VTCHPPLGWSVSCHHRSRSSWPVHRVFLFLPGVLGTASADTRCARHWRPFCFALLFVCIFGKAPRHSGFGPTTKFQG
jgi:hypothetical protein